MLFDRMFVSRTGDNSRDLLVFSGTKAVVEYSKGTDPEVIIFSMVLPIDCIGRNVTTRCKLTIPSQLQMSNFS